MHLLVNISTLVALNLAGVFERKSVPFSLIYGINGPLAVSQVCGVGGGGVVIVFLSYCSCSCSCSCCSCSSNTNTGPPSNCY